MQSIEEHEKKAEEEDIQNLGESQQEKPERSRLDFLPRVGVGKAKPELYISPFDHVVAGNFRRCLERRTCVENRSLLHSVCTIPRCNITTNCSTAF
jgi:hypothetical protein